MVTFRDTGTYFILEKTTTPVDVSVGVMTWTYKPWIGQLPSRATELLSTLVKWEITSEILSFERIHHFSYLLSTKTEGPLL